MNYTTILTSKGTTTIPAEIRKDLGITPGMQVTFTKNKKTKEYVLKRAQTIQEIRAINHASLQHALTSHKEYKSGDGFTQFITTSHSK